MTSRSPYGQPAPLDAAAKALIAAVRAAPEGDVLWVKEGRRCGPPGTRR